MCLQVGDRRKCSHLQRAYPPVLRTACAIFGIACRVAALSLTFIASRADHDLDAARFVPGTVVIVVGERLDDSSAGHQAWHASRVLSTIASALSSVADFDH